MHITSGCHVIRDDIEQTNHLREDKDTVPIGFQSREKHVKADHFARVHDETTENLIGRFVAVLCSFKEVRMIPAIKCMSSETCCNHDVALTRPFLTPLQHSSS